jgi:hypothetical protein
MEESPVKAERTTESIAGQGPNFCPWTVCNHRNVFDADTRMEELIDVHRVPSPLNGEKVAEGRMRGGNTQDSDGREDSNPVASVTTPHPTLSPLRGEGALTTRSFHVHPKKMRCALKSLLVALAIFTATGTTRAASVVIIPEKITLDSSAARQQLVVERLENKQWVGQITNAIQFSSSNTNVARVENGIVVPVRNGTTTIRARVGRDTAKAEVVVSGMEKPFEWSFRNHVQPVLARYGCSSGACHGAAAGKNGFTLSLRGYNDEGDYLALTRNSMGRRIVPSDPARSLLVLKPTGAIPHKGGQKFTTDSLEYRVLTEWIAAGTPGPQTNDTRIQRIEILPPQVTLKPGMTQQILVRAHFNDGHIEDVTRWAKYTSADQSVSTIEDNGQVKVVGHGEGAVTAWYLSRLAIATVSAPYEQQVPKSTFAKATKRNFIDEMALQKLQSLNIPPSPRCTDAEFIRRAFLDTIGVLPTAAETRAFLDNTSVRKRDALIESLLNRPEFVDYWTYKWSDLLLVQSKKLKTPAMWSYYSWIRNHVEANTPWDKFVREIVTAQGSTLVNGAGNFFVLHDDPRTMAETTSQAFLGMSINCAKCHNHPMEKWTNDQYYKMANLFARVRSKVGSADGDQVIFAAAQGELVQPLTGKPQIPEPLDGKPIRMDSTEDRREHLADWLVSPDNPYFSRAIVNRIWANFFGIGLVDPVDDLRKTNPASNEELLDATAKFLAAQKFDLKALMRAILQSETYQRSSLASKENAADKRFYSHYYPRRLSAEVLLDTYSQVTDVPTEFRVDLRNENRGLGDKFPVGFRATQLPDTRVFSYFLKTFGRPDREKTCECERASEPSVAQVLHILNGDTLNQKLAEKNNRVSRWLKEKTPAEQIVEEAYLLSLSRLPSEAEKSKMIAAIAAADSKDKRAAIEDSIWALLSSREFLFNH